MKRAIFDLPDETRANADAMRQVVADQISALNALADVVRNDSRVLSICRGRVFTCPRTGDPARENRGRRVHRSATRTPDAQKKKSSGAETKPSATALRGRQIEDELAFTVRSRPEAAQPVANARTEASSAVSERDTRSARRSRKLNAAARDLVEAIDEELPRDLEKRYSPPAKTMSISTACIDDREPAPAQASSSSAIAMNGSCVGRVDAYVRMFERYLDTFAAHAARASSWSMPPLPSESGKLYLLLAQASGRISPQ